MGSLGADNSVPPPVSESKSERDNKSTFSNESSEMGEFYGEFYIPEENLYLSCDASTANKVLSFEEIRGNEESDLFYSIYTEDAEYDDDEEDDEDDEDDDEEEEEEEKKEKKEEKTEDVEEEEALLPRTRSLLVKRKSRKMRRKTAQEEPRERSLFVHSSPTYFPDINRARKSVFGSIFLRTTADVTEETVLFKTLVESSYIMLQSLLNSFEKILSSPYLDKEKRKTTMDFRNSIQKALEAHGICKTYSDGGVYWSIYPIAQNHLYTVHIGENCHQTRYLSRIEERILGGSFRKLELPYTWPTGSVWSGYWNALGMTSRGTYTMPHGVSYNGKMQNGMFHDDNATLMYPSNFRAIGCVYEKGKLLDCQFQFPDKLIHKRENWQYCKFPDRRFWSEVENGLKPARIAQKTPIDPPKVVPPGCYDTGDGFYSHKTLMLVDSSGNLIRVPLCEEGVWIKKNCRKGFSEFTDFRPDLFENWFNYDEELIQSILNMQSLFREGVITYNELQQFYADSNLLPACSNYKRRKSPSEIAMEEFSKKVPPPKPLKKRRRLKKFIGHEIPKELIAACNRDKPESVSDQASDHSKTGQPKVSKTLLKTSKESKPKDASSQTKINAKFSKISFNLASDVSDEVGSADRKRKIPAKYLNYQPVIKLPFEVKSHSKYRTLRPRDRKCERKESSGSFDSSDLVLGSSGYGMDIISVKSLEKFMKDIILNIVTDILIKEREKHRNRLIWASDFPEKDPFDEGVNKSCVKILEELFQSIPEKEEFCDSFPSKTCDLKKLAEDKRDELKYWGTRIFYLQFDQNPKDE